MEYLSKRLLILSNRRLSLVRPQIIKTALALSHTTSASTTKSGKIASPGVIRGINCAWSNSSKPMRTATTTSESTMAATNSIADVINERDLQTKLNRIFSSSAEPGVYYSMEIAAKDDFDIGLMERLTPQPVFCSLPWISDENLRYSDDFLRAPTMQLSEKLRKAHHTIVNHVSCYNITEQQVDELLSCGVRNLFVIRGDTVHEEQKFQHSADLVQYLRKRQQETALPRLTIGVGGYPYGHHQSRSQAEELSHLKEKIDHGVDFLLTQTLYDAESFFRYRDQCRQAGITIPIIPGIYLPHSYRHLQIMLNLTRISLPPEVDAAFAAHANDPAAQFEAFVVDYFVGVLRELLEPNRAVSQDPIKLVHFFSFNKFPLIQTMLHKMDDFFH